MKPCPVCGIEMLWIEGKLGVGDDTTVRGRVCIEDKVTEWEPDIHLALQHALDEGYWT